MLFGVYYRFFRTSLHQLYRVPCGFCYLDRILVQKTTNIKLKDEDEYEGFRIQISVLRVCDLFFYVHGGKSIGKEKGPRTASAPIQALFVVACSACLTSLKKLLDFPSACLSHRPHSLRLGGSLADSPSSRFHMWPLTNNNANSTSKPTIGKTFPCMYRWYLGAKRLHV